MQDSWTILGVDRDATADELRRAYRTAAQIYHPDRYASASESVQAEAQRRMQQLNAALEAALAAAGHGTASPMAVPMWDARQSAWAQVDPDTLMAVLGARLQGLRYGALDVVVHHAPAQWWTSRRDIRRWRESNDWYAQWMFDDDCWVAQVLTQRTDHDPRTGPLSGWEWRPDPEGMFGALVAEGREEATQTREVADALFAVVQGTQAPTVLVVE